MSGRSPSPRFLPALRRLRRGAGSLYAAAGAVLAASLAFSLLGLAAFVALADEVADGDATRFDEAAMRWLDGHATPGLDVAALRVTALGDGLVVAVVGAVAASLLFLLGRRALAALPVFVVLGSWVVNPALKVLFDRDRPAVFEWRTPYAGSASFPSGHASSSMALYLALAYVVHRLARRRGASALALAVAAVVVLLVGASRVYLGVHYPSDVAAGYAVGFAWATLCALAVEGLPRLRGGPAAGGAGAARIRTSHKGS